MVSIIVPAYNVAEYLRECVDSILAQTYRDIEVILVDDGSQKDDTPQICDEYAAKDSRVKVVHKQNGGLPKARESGINASCGEFIYCVDADDSIEPDTIQSLMSLMTDDVDMVAAEEDIDRRMSAQEYGNWFLNWNAIHVWGKLYRRSVVADAWVFDFDRSITVAEDFVTNLRCLRNIKRSVVVSSLRKYHYRQLPVSMVHKFQNTPEYETKILNEALKVLENTPIDLTAGSVTYQIGMLEHFVRYRYTPDRQWMESLKCQAHSINLTLWQKLVLKTADNRIWSVVVRLCDPFIRACKMIKRKIKWG